MAFFDSKLTYGDFSRTGSQDCANAISIDEFDYKGGGTAREIVERTWAQWEADGMEDQWLEQQDDFEGLDPHKAYEAWAGGWKERAVGYIEREREEREREREYDEHDNPPPKHWWRRPSPAPRACYTSKAEALKAFLDTNSDIVENYGGADYEVSPSEFDSINHKYDLKGKKAVRSIAGAVWAAMPVGKPYCLDRIDIDALNDTSPAREAGVAFRLPDINYELQAQAEEAQYYAQQEAAQQEAEQPEPVIMGAGVLAGAYRGRDIGQRTTLTHAVSTAPIKVGRFSRGYGEAFCNRKLDLVDEGAWEPASHIDCPKCLEIVDRITAPATERVPPPTFPPIPSMEDIVPVRLQLVDKEPGVETYSINPRVPKAARFAVGSKVMFDDHLFTVIKTDYRSSKPAVLLRPVDPSASGVSERLAPVAHVSPAPVRLTLEEQEPGVSTYQMNPGSETFTGKLRERRALRQAIEAFLADTPSAVHDEDDIVEAMIEASIECDDYSFTPSAEMVRSVYRDMTGQQSNPCNPLGRRPSRKKELERAAERARYEQELFRGDNSRALIVVSYRGGKYDDNDMKIRDTLGDYHTGSGIDFSTGIVDHSATVPGTKADAMVAAINRIPKAKAKIKERWDMSNPPPHDNPAWVTKILAKHFVELEEEVPPKWLPKLTSPKASAGKLVAAMKEYGCGAYGCVLPTLDPNVVLKLTTDDTEAQFAHEMAAKLSSPVVVTYHLTRALPDRYKGREAYLLWRDSAEMVGDVAVAVSERGGDGSAAEQAIWKQHRAAQKAFDALHKGKPAEKLIEEWKVAAKEMGDKVPELRELADGMLTNLRKDRVFMGDVHSGNIGRVKGRWVVVDPGHIAVLT